MSNFEITKALYNYTSSDICELSDQPLSDTFSQAAGRLYKNAVFPAICVTASITLGSFIVFLPVHYLNRKVEFKGWGAEKTMKFYAGTVLVYSLRDLVKNSLQTYLGKDDAYGKVVDVVFSAAAHAGRVPIYQDDCNMIKFGIGALDGLLYSSISYFNNNPTVGRHVQILGAQSIEIFEYMVENKLSPAATVDFSDKFQNIGGLFLSTLFIDLSLADKKNFWYEYQQSVLSGVKNTIQLIKTIPTVMNNMLLINQNATHDAEESKFKPEKKTVFDSENGNDICSINHLEDAQQLYKQTDAFG
jgi:hypothetical protein